MLFAELRLILVVIMFIYVLVVVQPGFSYKNCFYKKRVYPTNNNFCNHSVFQNAMPTALLYKDQLVFTENFKKQVLRGIL